MILAVQIQLLSDLRPFATLEVLPYGSGATDQPAPHPKRSMIARKLRLLCIVTAYASVFIIVVLSLVPGGERPSTGMPDSLENFIAYFGAAVFCAFACTSWKGRLSSILGLIACSLLMETMQHFIPGRVPDVGDVIANGAGAALGTICAASGMYLVGVQL